MEYLIKQRMCDMKYIWLALKFIGYSFLAILLVLQIISFGASSTTKDFIFRGSILFVVGLYFAIKWQRKNKPKDTAIEDKSENS